MAASSPTTTPAPRVVSLPNGARVLVGLYWDREPRFKTPVLGAPALELTLAKRRAVVPRGPAIAGDASLLVDLATELGQALTERGEVPPEDRTWLCLADVSEAGGARYWLGLVGLQGEQDGVVIQPVIGPEDVFDDVEALCHALSGVASTMSLAGVALGTGPTGFRKETEKRIRGILKDAAPGGDGALRIEKLALSDRPSSGSAFALQPSITVRRVAALVGCFGVVLMAAGTLPQLIAEARRPDPTPAAPMIRVAPSAIDVAEMCSATLRAWWPRIVGWHVTSEGCALAGHIPAGTVPASAISEAGGQGTGQAPLVVWHRYAPDGSGNTVLTTRAADHVLRDWSQGKRVSDADIILWRVESLPLEPVTAAMEPDGGDSVLASRLEAIWADAPRALQRTDTGFTITTDGRADLLFRRVAGLLQLLPVQLRIDGSEASLTLEPRHGRLVPESSFDLSQEAAS